ncbi:hypothetical protein [Planococcus halotolerans]|uniref:Uncharacterized protein n=1 Tax=Planococcus halotolerans TaxID=2233542 RepID=A0A365KI85_9BACL|nr:hypothetical protein [Planococcus halotolerans]QHJ71617.1 hypothetical protein DNR44_013700 [Planococcus halotolerans]RAZ72765.1 hypothetical protein DP120_18200 [Planococcus halotolerans]
MKNYFINLYFQLQYIKSVREYLKSIDNLMTKKEEADNHRQFVWNVTIYDVLSNKELNKLVESLYRLDGYDYGKTIYLKKRKSRDLHYLGLEVNHTGSGLLAKIVFNKHKYFSELTMKYTQVTNQTVAIEYTFNFIKAISFSEESKFIKDNIKDTYFLNFTSIYFNSSFRNNGMQSLEQRERDYFRDIFQGFIVKNLYSNFGREYKLPIGYTMNYKKADETEENLKNPFLMRSLYNKKENYYIIIESFRGYQTFYQYFNGKIIPEIPFLDNFQYEGNEFYYNLFNDIENRELENKVAKYLLGNYKVVKKKDYLWLVNKLRALRDSEFKPNLDSRLQDQKNWEVRWNGEIETESFFTGDLLTKKYTKIYSDYHDYMKTLFTMQNDSIILTVGLFTLFFTLIGVIIAVL